VIGAEVATATTVEERLAAIWRNVAAPPAGDGGRWIQLEHELWSYAARDDKARAHLVRRYEAVWTSVDAALAEWAEEAGRPAPTTSAGPALIGVLLGLEMMRRIDPDAVDDTTAIATLLGAVGVRHQESYS
jgi:hypothetical protein